MTIADINTTIHERLTPEHYASLKSGRDQYSRLRYDDLTSRISDKDFRHIASKLGRYRGDGKQARKQRDMAAVMRWMLRGLHRSKPIAKVIADCDRAYEREYVDIELGEDHYGTFPRF